MGGHDVSLGDEEAAADHNLDDMEDGKDVDDEENDVTNSEEQPQDDSELGGYCLQASLRCMQPIWTPVLC